MKSGPMSANLGSTREPQRVSFSRTFLLELDNFVHWLPEDFVTEEGWGCGDWGAAKGGQG